MIVSASNTSMRKEVEAYQFSLGKNALVLDVGGAAGPWPGTTHVVDIQAGQEITGDIGREEVWGRIADISPQWDLVICSHTLEDIRDPGFVIGQINRISRAGFIAVPHKHTEMTSGVDSDQYVGYCHHRWIFTVQEEKLRIMAKWPITSCFRRGGDPGPGFLPWLDSSRAHTPYGPREELGVLWEGQLDWEYVRSDFAGLTEEGCNGLMRMYRDELAAGL